MPGTARRSAFPSGGAVICDGVPRVGSGRQGAENERVNRRRGAWPARFAYHAPELPQRELGGQGRGRCRPEEIDLGRRRISIGALLGGRALAGLWLACVTSGPVKPFEAADSGDRHPFARDNCADHGVEDRIDRVGGLLLPTELVGNRFDELSLVHVHPGRWRWGIVRR